MAQPSSSCPERVGMVVEVSVGFGGTLGVAAEVAVGVAVMLGVIVAVGLDATSDASQASPTPLSLLST